MLELGSPALKRPALASLVCSSFLNFRTVRYPRLNNSTPDFVPLTMALGTILWQSVEIFLIPFHGCDIPLCAWTTVLLANSY